MIDKQIGMLVLSSIVKCSTGLYMGMPVVFHTCLTCGDSSHISVSPSMYVSLHNQ